MIFVQEPFHHFLLRRLELRRLLKRGARAEAKRGEGGGGGGSRWRASELMVDADASSTRFKLERDRN